MVAPIPPMPPAPLSLQEPTNPRESVTVTFAVHDVRTARKLRTFQGPAHDYAIGANQVGCGHGYCYGCDCGDGRE